MGYLGMVFIISGWLIQAFSRGKEIKKSFVAVYALGVLLLVVGYFLDGLSLLGFLNLASFLSALAVYFKIRK